MPDQLLMYSMENSLVIISINSQSWEGGNVYYARYRLCGIGKGSIIKQKGGGKRSERVG
jgi:hypothetical protein